MTQAKRLKLLARTHDDLAVMSGLLQDGLILVQDMTLDQQSNSFIAIVSRFMWELTKEDDASDTPLPEDEIGDARFEDVPDEAQAKFFRTHTALRIQGAGKVEALNLPKDPKANLNLLSLEASDDGRLVTLTCSEGISIRVTTKSLIAGLEDLGEPWPTLYKPDHAT